MTTKEDLRRWYNLGNEANKRYMIVMCDTFDWDDYPVYCSTHEETVERSKNPGEMQKVMEIYDLKQDFEEQANQERCFSI